MGLKGLNWAEKFLVVFVCLVIGGGVVGGIGSVLFGGGGSSSPPQQAAQAAATPAPATQGKADFTLLVQKSYCFENPSTAYIYCNIWIRNTGDAAGGNPEVYVFLDYSDGGSAIVDNVSEPLNQASTAGSGSMPAHSPEVILIRHPYNAVGHDLIRAAATLDTNAANYPYIRVCTFGSC